MPLRVFHNTKINVQQFKTVRMHRFISIAVVTVAKHAKLSKFDSGRNHNVVVFFFQINFLLKQYARNNIFY